MKQHAFRIVRRVAIAMVGLLGLSASAAAPKAAGKATSGATDKSPAAETAAAEEPMGKVEGIEVKRGDGYFGVELVGGNFKITFYDKKRKVIAAPFTRAALRWPVNYRPADERAVVNVSGEGKALTSSKVVKPPYQFKLYITFLAEGADESGAGTESYVVDFKA